MGTMIAPPKENLNNAQGVSIIPLGFHGKTATDKEI